MTMVEFRNGDMTDWPLVHTKTAPALAVYLPNVKAGTPQNDVKENDYF